MYFPATAVITRLRSLIQNARPAGPTRVAEIFLAHELPTLALALERQFPNTFRWSNEQTGEQILCFGERFEPDTRPLHSIENNSQAAPSEVFSLDFEAGGGTSSGLRFTPEWSLRLCSREAERGSIAHHWGAPLAKPAPTVSPSIEHRAGFMWRVAQARLATRGALKKVVLARAETWSRVDEGCAEDDAARHLRLRRANPSAICFSVALAPGERFIGATPERLVALERGRVRSMALAGSAARGATPEADGRAGAKLLADPKERHEHALVVEEIRRRLGPTCEAITIDAVPHLRRLDAIQHLQSQVEATALPGTTLMDLVTRLHPTPAVCGAPRALARAYLQANSPLVRGAYAGPIGWMTPDGDGDSAVALRCAYVGPESVTAFAGVGVVPGSDPAQEWRETELKLTAMRQAFGAQAFDGQAGEVQRRLAHG